VIWHGEDKIGTMKPIRNILISLFICCGFMVPSSLLHAQEYRNSISRDVIQFSIEMTNNYVNSMSIPILLNIKSGMPVDYAVLVNDTNMADAVWKPYMSSNVTVTLGSKDGTYDVAVGLRGPPSNSQPAWQGQMIFKDTIPLKLVITNLTRFKGSRPFIDPAGYTTKAMSRFTFDVTNADGTITHDQGSVFDQDLNPADMSHTTNWFVCLDVALTMGVNHIGIQAVDWAGNLTTTNFSYIFDTNGDITPPAIALTWPQNGAELSGDNFTLRGTLGDDTAEVSGQWKDANGKSQTINGLVERGGQFWLENIPLSPGTNTLVITATDAADNTATTNLTLTQGRVTLTMDVVNPNELNQAYIVKVTGKISELAYTVFVNGVKGHNNGDGTWSAKNVPVTVGGTASFDVTAYSPDEMEDLKNNTATSLVSAQASLGTVPILLNLSSPAHGVFQVHLTNTAKRSFVLLASTNLVDWMPILTNSRPDDTFDYTDTNADKYHNRFFRVVPSQ
jgi:hypothetical protein